MPIDSISSVTDKPTPEYSPMPLPQKQAGAKSAANLTAEEQQEVEALKKRDTEVRQHERAHLAAAGPFAKGGAAYKFKTGPDGQRYAVSGEVEIDVTPVADDPAATIKKAQTIKKAALAPASPSSQDFGVAARARQMEAKAKQELAAQQQEQLQNYGRNGQPANSQPQPKLLNVMA
ncbi:MAG: hypothetical protein FOGNACKC_04798 [Anaerolineae bacterium]|nr:hypothetical protein [Anaerolineae bacterium]